MRAHAGMEVMGLGEGRGEKREPGGKMGGATQRRLAIAIVKSGCE